MDHETFLLLAAKQVAEELSDQEEADLTAHLASCPSCRAKAVALRRDAILLRGELGVATVSPVVRRRVLDEAAGVRRLSWGVMLALAATLLLAGVGVPLIAGGAQSQVFSPTLTPESTPGASPPVAAISPVAQPSPSPSASESAEVTIPSESQAPAWSVDGAFDWGKAPPKRDSVAAHLEGGLAMGEWSHKVPAVAPSQFYGGPITCLVVDGNDAWLAGPATTATDGTKGRAAFIHVHDGGAGGPDLVVLWLNIEGQTITTMEQWCTRRFIPSGPFPITSGNVTVIDGGG